MYKITISKYKYDRKTKVEPIQIGDRVLWHLVEATMGSSKKFNRRWKGPFIAAEMNYPNIKIEDRNGNFRWIHHNHIKKSLAANTDLDIIRNRGRPRTLPSWGGGVCGLHTHTYHSHYTTPPLPLMSHTHKGHDMYISHDTNTGHTLVV